MSLIASHGGGGISAGAYDSNSAAMNKENPIFESQTAALDNAQNQQEEQNKNYQNSELIIKNNNEFSLCSSGTGVGTNDMLLGQSILNNSNGNFTNNNNNMNNTASATNNYRHSRAYRHFKNPPQPHMCIRTTTVQGDELFINVLSWTRIVIPQEKNDPIPLYGGMRVPPGSPRCPPLCYAVMANPEVLKDSGRHSKDLEDRRAIVELMCDFVEAMNPDVKLTRNAVILKDRDISGELKDVWNAVQAQRDREREELLSHQRQQQQQQLIQQHYHQQQQPNATSQLLFPTHPIIQQQTGFLTGLDTMISTTDDNAKMPKNESAESIDNKTVSVNVNNENGVEIKSAIKLSNNKATDDLNDINGANDKKQQPQQQQQQEKSSTKDITDSKVDLPNINNKILNNSNNNNSKVNIQVNNKINTESDKETDSTVKDKGNQSTTTATIPTNIKSATTTPKKEKLGGFLPNGCIFPRFKNNKNKDKEKDKEKDSTKDNTTKSSNKEKTLLNSLKKVTSPSSKHNNQQQNEQQDAKQQNYEKNCLNLENQIEKLDLNKLEIESSSHAQQADMIIKLKAGGK